MLYTTYKITSINWVIVDIDYWYAVIAILLKTTLISHLCEREVLQPSPHMVGV